MNSMLSIGVITRLCFRLLRFWFGDFNYLYWSFFDWFFFDDDWFFDDCFFLDDWFFFDDWFFLDDRLFFDWCCCWF